MKRLRSKHLTRRDGYKVLLVVFLVLVAGLLFYRERARSRKPVPSILSEYHEALSYPEILVDYPLNGTVFPPEIPAPTFRWVNLDVGSDRWLVNFEFQDKLEQMTFQTKHTKLTLTTKHWESIKQRSSGTPATAHIFGYNHSAPTLIRGYAKITFETSKDVVGAPLFYREVKPPFEEAVRDLSRIRWRFDSISSTSPRIVLSNPPVCGSCHSFSRDGKSFVIDVDHAGNKGSFATVRVKEQTIITAGEVHTWDDFQKDDGNTNGFLSRISPDGRYVVGMVNDLFIINRDNFVDIFFPIKGILVMYDRENKTYSPLPGADDPDYVHGNPCWSPDGKTIVFIRAKALDCPYETKDYFLPPDESLELLKTIDGFRYDLYQIPFNDGAGGIAEPVKGASNNSMSNFFPRYSPDGKWIVYCQAKSYIMVQPDSKLHIIPAEGGASRRMECNNSMMNSWHSWSPNGRWLVFSSKGHSPFTQLFLTHIDDQGRSSPPVRLSHMTAADWAANVPEFINTDDSHAIKDIIIDF
ncbi:TolB family protein [Planctomycetota bacterium]